MNSNLSSFLNLSRWLAAFLVVISHIRHLIFVDYKDVQYKGIFIKGFYFISGFGHEAVILFFVISGFLVGGLTLKRWHKQEVNLRTYTSARVSRIYTVLVPALVIGLALDMVGMLWFDASELYTNSAQYNTISLTSKISESINFPTLLGNLFMVQNIFMPPLGSNGPLWSLAYEWWYYCIFGFSAAAIMGEGKNRFFYAAIAIVISSLLPEKLMLWGTVWLLGIAAHTWLNSGVWRPHPTIGFGVFVLAMAASRLSHNADNVTNRESLGVEFVRDFGLGITYVIALVSTSRVVKKITLPRLNERLAEFSYTTYLFHFPAMLFIVAVGYQIFGIKFQVQPSAGGFLYMFGTTVAIYIYCFAFSQLTERHTNVIRQRLDSFIAQKST